MTATQWKEKGDEAFKLKRFDVATDHYTKALETDPTNFLYFYQRALVLTFRGRSHLAIADYDSVLRLNPSHAAVRAYCGSMTNTYICHSLS